MSYINTLTTGTGTLTYYSDVTGNLQLQTDGNILIGMTNSATGRLVGIGTSTPAYNLDVVGNVRISGNLTVNGSNGFAFSDGTVQTSAASPYVLKNRIINGAFQVSQRGTTINSINTDYTYTADRWFITRGGIVNYTQGTTSPPTGFQYYGSYINQTASNPFMSIQQAIESINSYDLLGQTVTFSAYIKAAANTAASTSISMNYEYSTSADTKSPVTSVSGTTFTISSSAWTKCSITFTVPSNALTLVPYFLNTATLAVGDGYLITGVQLEQNTSATPFERRLYNQELAACQRYYTQSYDYGNVAGTIQRIGAITTVAPAAQNFLQLGQSAFPVSMRTTPAITLYNPDTGSSNITLAIRNYTGSSNLSASVATVSSTSLRVTLNNVASTTDSVYGVHYTASAEL